MIPLLVDGMGVKLRRSDFFETFAPIIHQTINQKYTVKDQSCKDASWWEVHRLYFFLVVTFVTPNSDFSIF